MPIPMTQKSFEISQADFNTFNLLYPQHGAWAWWFRTALRKFIDLHEVTSPEEIIELAMAETAREISNEDHSTQ